MGVRELIQQYYATLDAFAKGNPEPVKRLFSRRDDVTLANPFGPAVLGWDKVSQALDFASSRFRDGSVTDIESFAQYVGADLVTILDIERWQAKVSGRNELTPFVLRVTSTFRLEDAGWKLVHRHADPIASAHPDGPLRPTGA